MKFSSNYRKIEAKTIFEKTEASVVVPDQSYTVKEIITMHKRGVTPSLMKKALWEEDTFGELGNPLRKHGLDLTDLDVIKDEIKKNQEEINKIRLRRKNAGIKAEMNRIVEQYVKDIDSGKLDKNEVLQKLAQEKNQLNVSEEVETRGKI